MAVETQEQLAAAYTQQQQAPESQQDLAAEYNKQQSAPIPLGQAPSLTPPAQAYTKTAPGAAIPAPTAGAPATFREQNQDTSVDTGLKETGQDIWGAVRGMATTVVPGQNDFVEHIKEAVPAFHAYEAARSQGKGVIESLSAANDEMAKQQQARDVLKQRVDEFKKDPTAATTRAVGDAAAFAASIYAGSPGIEAAPEEGSAELAQAIEPTEAAGAPAPGILKPGYQEVAGTQIPVRATGTVSDIAEPLANTPKLKEFEVMSTQPAVRTAAGNIAADVADTQPPLIPPGKTDAFGFGRAAEELGARTSEGFQKVDEFHNGKFSDAQDEADTARGSLDYAGKQAYNKAMQTQSDMIDQYGAANPDEDVASLKADWRQKSGLEELATRFNRSVGPTPVELTQPDLPDNGYVNPTTFRNALIDAQQNGEFEKAGFGRAHVQSMEDLGRILEQAKPATGFNKVLSTIVRSKAVGGLIGGGVGSLIGGPVGGAIGAVAGLGSEWAIGKVLGSIMTDLPSLQSVTEGLAAGASPATVAKAVSNQPGFIANLKSTLSGDEGSMRVPGTSKYVSRLSDNLSGLKPSDAEITDATARINAANEGQKVAPGTDRQQLVEKYVARQMSDTEPTAPVLSSKDAMSKQPPAQKPPVNEKGRQGTYTFPESLSRPPMPAGPIEPLSTVKSTSELEATVGEGVEPYVSPNTSLKSPQAVDARVEEILQPYYDKLKSMPKPGPTSTRAQGIEYRKVADTINKIKALGNAAKGKQYK
jgi:hypothetical protein